MLLECLVLPRCAGLGSQNRVVSAIYISPTPGFRCSCSVSLSPLLCLYQLFPVRLFSVESVSSLDIRNTPCPHFHASLLRILNLLMLFSAAPWYWEHPLFFPTQISFIGLFSTHDQKISHLMGKPGPAIQTLLFRPGCAGSFPPVISCTDNISWGMKRFSLTLGAGPRGHTAGIEQISLYDLVHLY